MALVGTWPLGVVRQIIASSDGFVRANNARIAKGTVSRDMLCISLLEGEARAVNGRTFKKRE